MIAKEKILNCSQEVITLLKIFGLSKKNWGR